VTERFWRQQLSPAGVRVEIRVVIDATGRVVRAEALSRGGNLVEYLSAIASDAARKWRFAPALRGTEPVPSETILQFQFGGAR
jgi:outer membrane biosynthesis protein TonB